MKPTFKAFTLIEVLVAMWIVTVAILGPLTVAINSSSTTRNAKDVVVSAYLAQESFDLLRFTRDTIFLKCITNDVASCTSIPLPAPSAPTEYENGPETAWRLFKEVLANGGGANSCIVSVANPDGCTYDIEGFLDNGRISPAIAPTIYAAGDTLCEYLNRDDRKQNYATSGPSYPTDGMYLCDDQGGTLSPTSFRRVVKVTSIPAIAPAPALGVTYDEIYNDDLRIEVEVSYSKSNSLTKKIKVVDFIRART